MTDFATTGLHRGYSPSMPQTGTRKQASTWLRFILGGIFIAASVSKILHPAEFAKIIFNYQLLPNGLVNAAAIILPWLELLLGIFLFLGFWLPGTVALCNLLLATFFAALSFNTARGLNIHCGCFSTSTAGDPDTLWYFVRDSSFLLIAGYLFYSTFLKRKVV